MMFSVTPHSPESITSWMSWVRCCAAWLPLNGRPGVGTTVSEVGVPIAEARLRIVAEDLRLAQSALAGITGQVSADDLLGEIFGRFCIGK